MNYADVLPSEKIAFIAYNIGVYESVQKFGNLITSGKIMGDTDVPKVAELLSKSSAFYDAEMIAGLINAMISHVPKSTVIDRVTAEQVRYVMDQLKATGAKSKVRVVQRAAMAKAMLPVPGPTSSNGPSDENCAKSRRNGASTLVQRPRNSS